jgi:hypothetical protein
MHAAALDDEYDSMPIEGRRGAVSRVAARLFGVRLAAVPSA